MTQLFFYICLCLAVAAISCNRSSSSCSDNQCCPRNGRDGRDGRNGVDGRNGKDGNGRDGVDGKDGKDGVHGLIGKKGDPGVNGTNGLDGKDGIDGVHGLIGKKGDPGVNGTNGLDGKDGIDGVHGLIGKKGDPGVSGTNGMNGKDGKDGINGIDGLIGKKGDPGVNGTNGMNGKDGKDAARKNWKECAWNNVNDDKDIGLVKDCAFKKKSTTTHLKVMITTNMRIFGCIKCCKRWYVTFESKECSPVPIDGIVYMSGPSGKELLRVRTIAGHCKVSKTGNLNVGLNIGNCVGYGNYDGHTGWNSSTHIFVEEVVPPQA